MEIRDYSFRSLHKPSWQFFSIAVALKQIGFCTEYSECNKQLATKNVNSRDVWKTRSILDDLNSDLKHVLTNRVIISTEQTELATRNAENFFWRIRILSIYILTNVAARTEI